MTSTGPQYIFNPRSSTLHLFSGSAFKPLCLSSHPWVRAYARNSVRYKEDDTPRLSFLVQHSYLHGPHSLPPQQECNNNPDCMDAPDKYSELKDEPSPSESDCSDCSHSGEQPPSSCFDESESPPKLHSDPPPEVLHPTPSLPGNLDKVTSSSTPHSMPPHTANPPSQPPKRRPMLRQSQSAPTTPSLAMSAFQGAFVDAISHSDDIFGHSTSRSTPEYPPWPKPSRDTNTI
ncbi:hypothetical protein BU17DRAFT_98132 [Hysterangium stoloniferum]|nr:hypothetical protein BU17DRAFT_98132 [Hysterangium stoloniferum]